MITVKIFVITALAALASAQVNPVQMQYYYTTHNQSHLHVDNYLNANRRQYLANIWSYDLQIQTFRDLYLERLNIIDIHKESLINSLIKNDERLYPMELINEFQKQCVDKYKPLIPTVAAVKFNMDKCKTTGTSQLNSLVSYPTSTNNTLQSYYLNTFEKSVQSCEKTYPSAPSNYSTCVINAVTAANIYTANSQKTFATQLASSYSSAKAYVKTAMECSSAEINRTSSLTAQANTLIDRCFQGKDNCGRCGEQFCDDVYYMPSYLVDYKNDSMRNVFYGRSDVAKCLMISVYNNTN